jgi:acetylornithine deacetylase/succinyl-diaminopimelate desuccinylase-like protein
MSLDKLGVDTVTLAFALDDEKMHAPDEFLRLNNFERGQRGYCLLFEQLSSKHDFSLNAVSHLR